MRFKEVLVQGFSVPARTPLIYLLFICLFLEMCLRYSFDLKSNLPQKSGKVTNF